MVIYTDVEKAWQAMLKDISSAKKSILLEQYLVRDMEEGSIGFHLAKLLIEKAKEGIEVRLLVDAIGSHKLILSNLWNEMKDAGVVTKVFGLFPKWRFEFRPPFFDRNHRKLLIIDNDTVHIGGVVFTESVRGWEDFNVEFRGNAEAFRKSFEIMWYHKRSEVNNQVFPAGDISVANIIPFHDQYHKELLRRIKKAKDRIVVISPYFSPDLFIRRALFRAAKRGVEVKVILPQKTDNILADMSSRSFIGTLLRKRFEIYLNKRTINHAKIVIIDDWITFGSMNFDRLSFFYNYELNVESELNPTSMKLIEEALQFLKQTEPVNKKDWKNVSFKEKFQRKIGFLLRPFV